MTDERIQDENETVEDAFVESLLQSFYGNAAQECQAKVTDVLRKLDVPISSGVENFVEEKAIDDTVVSSRPSRNRQDKRAGRRFVSRPAIIAWVSAALILLAVSLPMLWSPQSAMATIRQSIKQAAVDVARHYRMTTSFRLPDGSFSQHDGDLYVQGHDQIVIRKSGPLFKRDFWLGVDGEDAWVVPPIGPVLEGDQINLFGWMKGREKLETPYMHVSTILERMSKGYQLDAVVDDTIQNDRGEPIDCRYVVGHLTFKGERNAPNLIELWTNRETGIAQKVVASWELESTGRESMTLEFIDEPVLGQDWFRAEGHYEGIRRQLDFDSKERSK